MIGSKRTRTDHNSLESIDRTNMMPKSTGNGPAPNAIRRGENEVLRTKKRSRSSLADQDPPSNEPPSLRGGGRGSFTPAAGTWKKPTAQDPTQNRLFSNLARVPVNAGLGIRPPTSSPARTPAAKRPTRRTSGRRGQTSTGTQTGPAGLTPGESTEGEGDRDANASRTNSGSKLRNCHVHHLCPQFRVLAMKMSF